MDSMIEEEDRECLKIHGYVSSSENESEPDESKFEFDEQFEALKPPPIIIDPEKHKIILIEDDGDNSGPIQSNMRDSGTGRVCNSNVLLHIVDGKVGGNVSKKLSKGQRQETNNIDSFYDNNHPSYSDKIVYDVNFPPLGGFPPLTHKSSLISTLFSKIITKSNEKEKEEESTRENDNHLEYTDTEISKLQKKLKRKKLKWAVKSNNMQDSKSICNSNVISLDVEGNVLDKLSIGQQQKANTIKNLKDCDSFCDNYPNYSDKVVYDRNFPPL